MKTENIQIMSFKEEKEVIPATEEAKIGSGLDWPAWTKS
jgi:hypothetical protein